METEVLKGDPILRAAQALSIALGERDMYTRHHCNRVTSLATELGNACGLQGSRLEQMRVAATFHDVGKIGVPDAVLLKPSKLTAEEWELMKAHSEKGENIFRGTTLPDVEVLASIIRHHHESFDGSGYPDGLRGEQIPVSCRILLIVDCYDAMTTVRPYSKARSHAEAMGILLKERGAKVDPQVLSVFARLIEHSEQRAH